MSYTFKGINEITIAIHGTLISIYMIFLTYSTQE